MKIAAHPYYRPLLFLYLAMLLFSVSSRSQPSAIRFKVISREQGLSNSTVQAIIQDNKGFMWFGTAEGLNRYDGYNTSVYLSNPTDTSSLTGNYISCLLEDKHHQLWVGTSSGLSRYNANQDKFYRFTSRYAVSSTISSNTVNCLYQDRQQNLWVGTAGGLNLYSYSNNQFTRFNNPGSTKPEANITCLCQDGSGSLWIGTAGGLFSFNTKAGKFTPYRTDESHAAGMDGQPITAIAETANGDLVVGMNGAGIAVISPNRQEIKLYQHNDASTNSLSSDVVKSICSGKNGIWIGTENGGLNLLQLPNALFTRYENNLNNPLSLSQKTASAVFEDHQGNLWVGTHRGGVNLYSPLANRFITYTQGAGLLSYKDVKTFFEETPSLIWIGTDGGGINIWNRSNNQFLQYRHQPGNPASIGSDAILHIMQDKQGNIWTGTWGGGLNLYLGNGKFKRYLHNPNDPNSISSNNVWRIFEDQQGNLWVATFYGGLNLFDRQTQRFKRITGDSLHQTPFLGNNVVSINQDVQGNLWFGTDDGGLNCYVAATGRFEHYFNQSSGAGAIGNLRVIFNDNKKRLWVGKKGLFLFDYTTNSFHTFTQNTILANENIQGITEDNEGIFWISTHNGLFSLNPETKEVHPYNTNEGLQGLEFNQNACLRLSGDEMLFGGFNGFNLFNPDKIQPIIQAPPVYLTGLQIFNKNMNFGEPGSPLRNSLLSTTELKLYHSQSFFSLEYAAPEYVSPGQLQYAYKLDGFDKNWNYVGNQRKATFTNLNPGSYLFHVRAGTQDGTWGKNNTDIHIIILPPFWITWWFRLAAVLLAMAVIYTVLFYRRRYEIQKLDEQKAREMQQMQLQFFTNISHEFRTPLSLIAGPLEKLKEEDLQPAHKQYYQMMQRNVNRLMALISELMDFRKVEAGALQLKVMPGSFEQTVQNITEDFREMALQKNIDFQIKVPGLYTEEYFDHQVIEKIVINLVHNAFKYTQDGGIITIEVLHSLAKFTPLYENDLTIKSEYFAKRNIYLRIADTGRGISKESIRYLFERYYRITQEHLGSGVGLAFVKSLTLLHKGSIQVYSQPGKGTEIIIAFPCQTEDYKKEENWIKTNGEVIVALESIRYKPLSEKHILTETSVTQVPAGEKRLLIVDDNEELRHFLKASLGESYQLTEAENGAIALQKAKQEMPDLIISDVMMPVMDGTAFCKAIKEDIETSHIPFILLTAKDALESRLDGIGGGADYYFSKPVSMQLLQLTIRNLFEQRQKIKERYSHDYKVEVRELVHSAIDKEFMDTLLALVEEQLESTELNVDFLCQKIGMSKTKLYKKIKDLTGQTINEFIRTFRLKKATEIMIHEDVNVTEVMYRVGIQSNSYFTTAFKKEFGKTPSQFMQELNKERLGKI